MLLISPWSTIYSEDSVYHPINSPDYSDFVNDETIAVPMGFHHSTYVNYSDVAIVINNRSTDSVLIGNAFASARGIPPERIFLLNNESTPTSETINSDQFDTYFADPIRLMIQQRGLFGDLNYLVTTKGIPLRINGGTNVRASFDSELALIDSGQFGALIHGSYWGEHEYGPWSNDNEDEYAKFSSEPVPEFRRSEQGFYIVTRLTGYDVDTAISLINKANNSFGSHGQTVLDLATNRNGSGYKFWNDALYSAHSHLNQTLGMPVLFNQNSTFVTGENNVMMYASWGSNDESWSNQQLPDNGFDTPDSSSSSGIRSWSSSTSTFSVGETLEWDYDSDNSAARLSVNSAQCSATNGENTNGLLAEYF
ncbi:MAG: TIGR03790 family protein, partial [Candidatus Thermoplasmatota archaeon]|nr:TIGR03790 family protein [Candidatus Thermoplasmatota archaeon]